MTDERTAETVGGQYWRAITLGNGGIKDFDPVGTPGRFPIELENAPPRGMPSFPEGLPMGGAGVPKAGQG